LPFSPLNAQQLNELRLAALVACDAAYAGTARPAGSTLSPYVDGDSQAIPFSYRSGFVIEHVLSVPETGLKVAIYKHQTANELLVAFAGTDGLNVTDWFSNAFHLGLNQWSDGARANVFEQINRLSTSDTVIHFTGQSLGGALAQFAAHDLLVNGSTFDGRVTLTTFNSLGGIAALKGRFGFQPSVASKLLHASHFRITNDLISRLGEGHFGGKMYEFSFIDYWRYNEHGEKPFFGPVDAHRIESGFYANLAEVNSDFGAAREVTPEEVDYLQIDSLQKLVSRWGNPLSVPNSAHAAVGFVALVASVLPAIEHAPPEEVNELVWALYDHAYFGGDISEEVWHWSKTQDYASILKPIAREFVLGKIAAGGAIVLDSIIRHLDNEATRPVLDYIAARRLVVPTVSYRSTEEADAKYEFTKWLIQFSGLELAMSLSPAQIESILTEVAGSAGSWIVGAKNKLSEAISPAPAALSALVVRLANAIEEIGKTNAGLSNGHAVLAQDLLEEAGALVSEMSTQVASANADYTGPQSSTDPWKFGNLTTFAEFHKVRQALQELHRELGASGTSSAVAQALQSIERAGQRVVLAEGRGANPFDLPNFSGDSAIGSSALREGSVRTFTAYLPYDAGAGGQHIAFRLSGAAASKLGILLDADGIAVGVDNEFDLLVPEGAREITFGIRALQDIDLDETLTISAQLVDASGVATHHSHIELNLAFDATVEPTTNPTTTVTGTAQDDNRNGDSTHRPVNGSVGADHIRALAGRDEAAGFAGDDLIEGGTGADILAGDEGADRVFADAAMDDAALRNYIASTAAIIDNTHPSLTSDASAADWIVGDLGDDTLVGSAAPDLLFGGGGSDLIVGGAGHDIIDGDDDYRPGALTGVQAVRAYQGRPHQLYFSSVIWNQLARNVGAGDQIHGGAGDDFVRALHGDDTVLGDNGDDTIAGDAGNDSLFGNAGNDRIAGGAYGSDDTLVASGDDYLDGGAGDDILSGESGADVIVGGTGNDVLHGFIGVTFVGAPNETPTSDGDDYLSGGAGADILVGASGADILVGGDQSDQLFGDSDQTPEALQGNDDLDGGAGDDYLRGYGGDDRLFGGAGNDVVHGEGGADHVDGGIDDDDLFGMDGDDMLLGGAGEDQLVGDEGADILEGAIDDDHLWGGAGDDRLDGGSGSDYLDGGDGMDTLSGAHGADWIYARGGNDIAGGGVDNDVVIGGDGSDALDGGDGDDQLWGENDDDTLEGDGGNDQLIGGAGSDVLEGGEGLDQLWGEAGDDTLSGGAGRDYLMGGAGNDVYRVDSSTEDVIVDTEGQNTIRFADGVVVDELRFRQGIDASGVDRYLVIEGVGTRGRVIVRGGMDGAIAQFAFDDGSSITHAQVIAQLTAQGDVDKKPIGATSPALRYGTTANDLIVDIVPNGTVYAGSGDDTVTGASGAETLNGDAGADRLDGSGGSDTLIGGEGTDTYVFGRDRGRDAIEEKFVSQSGATQTDTVELASGVLPADVTLHRDGIDLVLAISQTAAQLRVRQHFVPTERVTNPVTSQQEFWPSDHRIERIRFANGTVWDAAAIASRTVVGTPNTASGTVGNDVFTVDSHDDIVNESASAGDDTIQSSVSFALRANIERLTLTGFVDTNAWSNAANPTSYLTGNAGNNVFNGPGTYFNGSTQVVTTSGASMGYAVMTGAGGDDTYHLRDTVGGQVVEGAAQGYDTVVLNGPNWHNYQLPANVEALVSAEGGVGIVGTTRVRVGNALDNYLEGSRTGVPGTSLDNVIDGGAGADTMVGFDDNDRFIVDNARDLALDRGVFTNGSQASLQDEVLASVSYELPDNIEIIRLTGTAPIDARGNDLANTLDGSTNAASNTLAGGLGDDRYVAHANDSIVERAGEGIDVVEWRGTGTRVYTASDLPAEVEGIAFGDDLGNADYSGDARFDRVAGNAGRNILDGAGGDDMLEGGAGDDTLIGGSGDDQLNGGAGYDVLRFSRGFGHDTAYGDASFEIAFDNSIGAADLRFVDGHLEIAGSADRLDLGSAAPLIRFADGTSIAGNEVFAMLAASRSTTATAAADMLTGTDAANTIDALGGDDFIYGRAGADVLSGNDGNDRLYGEGGNDTLTGEAGNDYLDAGADDDIARGGTGNDTLRGGTGRDSLDGQHGDDTLHGDDDDDVVTGGGGQDTLYGGAGNDVLTLVGGTGVAFGEAGDDQLLGGDQPDFLSGGEGHDRMHGGAGDDSLSGEAGVDIYVLSRGVAPDEIVLERIVDEFDVPTLYVRIADSTDELHLPHYGRADRPLELRFEDGTVWTPAIVLERLSRVEGTDLDDVLTGSAEDDLLQGRAGNDTLTGLAGNDTLDGGTGADRLEGGEGNDRYVVDEAGDVIVEFANEGVDVVESAIALTLPVDVENLLLVDAATNATGNALGNTLVGNAAANVIDGRQGADTMRGAAGNDTYVVDSALDAIVENAGEGTDTVNSSIAYMLGANVENLVLSGTASIAGTGNASANVLVGNAGANVLDGKGGVDTMRGAAGNDVYVIDMVSDVIVEIAAEGIDTVQTAVTYTLGANLENLTLIGTSAIHGTGNAAANALTGNAAANQLDGAAGNDSLRGGAGNDTYVVDSTGDSVVENAGEGTDVVNASASFTLGANVETLTLTGAASINATGNALANTLVGNAASNTLNGGAGGDTMRGGAGNDVYVVDAAADVVIENVAEGSDTVQSSVAWTLGANVENLVLTGTGAINGIGNAAANSITGNTAANLIDGGAGSDTLAGGAGNDTYLVDNALDVVNEAASAGMDVINASVSYSLAVNLENLTLTGTAATNGTGNTLPNTLQGNAAANVLDGGAGADTMRGGAGNDTFVVESLSDVVVENAAEGDDTLRSFVGWTLAANVENLTLVGTSAINGTGNAAGNWLLGNAAGNSIAALDGQDLVFGGAGNDTLSGGNGRDILQGGDGNDSLADASGNNLLHGGIGTDVLTGGTGAELFAGGAGNDTITVGTGADIVAFNRGDGQDVVNAATGTDNVLALGGGIRYADVALRKSGNDLIVDVGATEQLTFKDWYVSVTNRHVVDLQMVVDASADWNASSTSALVNKRVARFDFAGLVSQFDAARTTDPLLTQWNVAGALASEHLGGSDTAAIGGDLAYQYGRSGSLSNIGWTPADTVLASASFGVAMQTLQAPATLFGGPKTLS
jgi:Ca2+-binding RTX toxin-like protein